MEQTGKMSDEKLNKLIEAYGMTIANLMIGKSPERVDKAKQAILDYHIKIKNEWFEKGVKAGKISNNGSGCCCVFEDDGETIQEPRSLNLCAPHKAMVEKQELDKGDGVAEGKLSRLLDCAKQEATVHIRKAWEKYKDSALNQLAQMGIDRNEEDYVTETWQAISKTMKALEEK